MVTRVAPEFSHVRDWIFDLDNCLYPASTGPVRADRRADGRLHPAAARLRVRRSAPGPEGSLPRAWNDARRPDASITRSTRIISSTTSTPSRSTGFQRNERLGGVAGPAARPALRLHQRRRALCPPSARRDRRRTSISTICTTSTPAATGPSPTRTATSCCASASESTRQAAAGRRHGAESEAGESARDDHGVGRQWLGARQPRRRRELHRPSHRRCRANGSNSILKDDE